MSAELEGDMTWAPADDPEALVQALLAAEATIENLRIALRTNRTIGIAIGIVMNGLRVTEAAAFEVLRDESSRSSRKLNVVAREVAETGVIPQQG